MRTTVAYVLAVTAAPFMGSILSLIPGLLLIGAVDAAVKKSRTAPWLMIVIATIPAGLLTGWIGLKLFDWLGVPSTSTVLIAQSLISGLAARSNFRGGKPYTDAQGVGQVLGLGLLGYWWFSLAVGAIAVVIAAALIASVFLEAALIALPRLAPAPPLEPPAPKPPTRTPQEVFEIIKQQRRAEEEKKGQS